MQLHALVSASTRCLSTWCLSTWCLSTWCHVTRWFVRFAVLVGIWISGNTLSFFPAYSTSFLFSVSHGEQPNTTAEKVDKWLEGNLQNVIQDYAHLHSNPEVSFAEQETGKFVAARWREVGFDVTTSVGGHGVVGILTNGEGPTVMLRTDLDALPVEEATPLPFASKKRVMTEGGGESGVMHACGHDVHMSNLIGVAQFMSAHRELWAGTLHKYK